MTLNPIASIPFRSMICTGSLALGARNIISGYSFFHAH